MKEESAKQNDLTKREDDVLASMPKFVSEMQKALLEPGSEFTREFFVLPFRGVVLRSSSKARFVYFEAEYQNLRGQLDILEAHGFLINVTPL